MHDALLHIITTLTGYTTLTNGQVILLRQAIKLLHNDIANTDVISANINSVYKLIDESYVKYNHYNGKQQFNDSDTDYNEYDNYISATSLLFKQILYVNAYNNAISVYNKHALQPIAMSTINITPIDIYTSLMHHVINLFTDIQPYINTMNINAISDMLYNVLVIQNTRQRDNSITLANAFINNFNTYVERIGHDTNNTIKCIYAILTRSNTYILKLLYALICCIHDDISTFDINIDDEYYSDVYDNVLSIIAVSDIIMNNNTQRFIVDQHDVEHVSIVINESADIKAKHLDITLPIMTLPNNDLKRIMYATSVYIGMQASTSYRDYSYDEDGNRFEIPTYNDYTDHIEDVYTLCNITYIPITRMDNCYNIRYDDNGCYINDIEAVVTSGLISCLTPYIYHTFMHCFNITFEHISNECMKLDKNYEGYINLMLEMQLYFTSEEYIDDIKHTHSYHYNRCIVYITADDIPKIVKHTDDTINDIDECVCDIMLPKITDDDIGIINSYMLCTYNYLLSLNTIAPKRYISKVVIYLMFSMLF